MTTKKRGLWVALVALFILAWTAGAHAHCEIPCGIYGDEMRVSMMEEDITTVEKSMKEIIELQKQSPINYNQLVRWIMNKENHADKIQEVVSQYFMTQRIKPEGNNYVEKLTLLHKMLLQAMLCKQTTDLSHVNELRSLLQQFSKLYFEHSHQ